MTAPETKGMYWDGCYLGLPCGNTRPNIEYTRSDLCLELVAAAYEDAANLHQSLWRETSAYKTDQILKRTPTDAQATLAARDARIRGAALREAAEWAESEGLFRTRDEILALITKDATDD